MAEEYRVRIGFRNDGDDETLICEHQGISPDFTWFSVLRDLMIWQVHEGPSTIVWLQVLMREDDEWFVYREINNAEQLKGGYQYEQVHDAASVDRRADA